MRRMMTVAIVVLLVGACGASGAEPEPSGHAGDDHAHHHTAGGHGHHQHTSPDELRPLMHDLHGWLGELSQSLEADDLPAAATHARAIATACDDAELEELDPELFGPRFLEIDRELHGAAARLAERADAADAEGAQAGYHEVVRACVSCHEQAPTASEVTLGELAPAAAP